MLLNEYIQNPSDPVMERLCARLSEMATTLNQPDAWVAEQLTECGRSGVFAWFMEDQWGGLNWSELDQVKAYLALSAACLTTTFVITQRTGACRRIADSDNKWIKQQYLPDLTAGNLFATVGISHLTTSRRHLAKPVLTAERRNAGFVLNGYSPWVTGAPFADAIVIGATLPDKDQVLLLVPGDLNGVEIPPTPQLVALSASRTGEVRFDNALLDEKFLLAGPHPNVMSTGTGAATGGLQTSTLAIGLAKAAIDFIGQQSEQRTDLQETSLAIGSQWRQLCDNLLGMAEGNEVCSSEALRTRANSLALRATQAALAVAKGAGFVETHPAGRWCREALFFLVWSCPQPVTRANLCELAGIQ